MLIIVGKVDNQDAFRMAQDVGNQYGIGYKKSRRGLVIVIAVEDHKYFIAPGSGLEGELTDVDCDDIARACIVKYMREGNPGEAVASVSRAIYNKVKSGRTGIADVDEGSVNDEEDWFLVIILVKTSVFNFCGSMLPGFAGFNAKNNKKNLHDCNEYMNNDELRNTFVGT